MTYRVAMSYRNPRSILHGLKPLGQGCDQAESLTSYFCRLANSHCTSTLELSRKLLKFLGYTPAQHYKWYQRQISGLGEGAQTYTAALAATTSVEALHLHTFLPWKGVISEHGLPLHKAGQFCPQCFYEDQQSQKPPYLRLCWEPELVTVCHRHSIPLRRSCPHCEQDNVRHTHTFTVVGWCGKCKMFMGQDTPAQELDEFELWKAQQIAQLVELQQSTEFSNDKEALLESIAKVIEQTCSGKYAGLAKHLGIAKSTICGWLQEKRVPSADTSLRIARFARFARFAQVDWATLLMGIPDALELPELTPQLSLPFDFTARPKWTRQPQPHDWSHVEQQLQAILKQPMPVSVTHAASVVRIPARMLYMYCNTTARKIGQRWLEHLQRRQLSHVVTAWPHLEKACRWLLDNGIAPNMREVEKLVPAEILSPISNTWDAIREVRQYIESSEHATAGICDNAYPRKLVMD